MKQETVRSKCVLLLDDDRLVLTTIAGGLRHAGYDVLCAGSAAQADALLAEHRPDIGVLDVRMPGESGIDFADVLRRQQIPFIFLTAYSDSDVVSQAASAGALGYVVKPVDAPQLVPAIEAALSRAEELRRLRDTERQLQTALTEGREVSVAIGILMERHHFKRDSAFELLRKTARSQRRRLVELARELVEAADTLNSVSH